MANNKYWQGCENIGPVTLLVGNANRCCHFQKQLGSSLTKIKHRITMRPSNSGPRYLPKRTESRNLNRYSHAHVHGSLMHNIGVEITQIWKMNGEAKCGL